MFDTYVKVSNSIFYYTLSKQIHTSLQARQQWGGDQAPPFEKKSLNKEKKALNKEKIKAFLKLLKPPPLRFGQGRPCTIVIKATLP